MKNRFSFERRVPQPEPLVDGGNGAPEHPYASLDVELDRRRASLDAGQGLTTGQMRERFRAWRDEMVRRQAT